jgi:uncharacterized membrane protein YeiH
MENEHVALFLSRLDLAATYLFSMTGALVAIRRHYDFVGLFVLALCTGVGGGLLRDGIFIQDGPPAAMRDANYLWAVLGGCLTAAIFQRSVEKLGRLFLVVDALGLAAYGVVGYSKSISAGLAVPAAILVGVVNAAGGSVIRDVLVGVEPLVLKPGQLYMLASAAGVTVGASLRAGFQVSWLVSAGAAIAVTFILRMLSILFNWKSGAILPESSPPPVAGDDKPG